MHVTRLLQFVGAVAIVGFLLVSFTPLATALSRWTGVPVQIRPAAAIVVLGGGLDADHVLSTSSLRRMIHGIVLFQRGLAPLLVFSGPTDGRHATPEAEVRADMARQFGVPAAAILTETTALTTRDEAARMAALLQPLGISSILLVTDYEHMARAQQLFAKLGFVVQPAPIGQPLDIRQPEARLALMRRVVQECLARIYYRAFGYL